MNTQQFWTWFQKLEKKYYYHNKLSSEEFLNRIKEFRINLLEVNKYFGYIIKFKNDKSMLGEIIITAYGNKEIYQDVEAFVNEAPLLNHWKVIAFLQPSEDYKKFKEYIKEDFDIALTKLYFQPVKYYKTTKKFKLHFYSDQDLSIHHSKDLKALVIEILANYLGEKYLYEKIKDIKVYKNNRNRGRTYPFFRIKHCLKKRSKYGL
ncbi:MAG: hypothetical protein CVU03_02360 [Bacteroidetes bacterium HGW-Bacteroidetes-2]|jgi:phosphoribosylformylglycinamidine (FGAM) synthase PurS component|nr:MAG: hypothetical protein CVU13_05955 [Bacteroidetes bacterium HGW-Bacteroidetes-8]PKP26738.1 MAG: hypothetical protein CVU03_02360 [Bacteroidetes bacterium HGW-Bacteroidetes-2]